MRIFIRHRHEGQARKLLDQEIAEEYFQRLVEFGPTEPEPLDEELDIDSIDEADEIFDWISGQYSPLDELDHSADLF